MQLGYLGPQGTFSDEAARKFVALEKEIPVPKISEGPLQILVSNINADAYKGRIAVGRVYRGVIKAGQDVMHINRDGVQKKCRISALMGYTGLARTEVPEAMAGDIVAIAGISDVTIGETLADCLTPEALPLLSIEEPTVKMTFSVNDSPFAGKEGKFTTSRQINERLMKEMETDIALKVELGEGTSWVVAGRGELHLAILLERMRREGYEIQVSRPQVVEKLIDGKKLVPFERIFVEVPDEYSGVVIQKLGSRNGLMKEMRMENGITFLEFVIPTRGLFGYRAEFLVDTRGLGIINPMFEEFGKDPGNWRERDQGSLVAHETGQTALYGLTNVQDRGVLFIGPAVQVYKGQVIGQHQRSGDLRVNPCKAKELSNMRSKGDGPAEHFNQPKTMELEDALEYIGDDELVEITPINVRIRKMILDEQDARRKALGIK